MDPQDRAGVARMAGFPNPDEHETTRPVRDHRMVDWTVFGVGLLTAAAAVGAQLVQGWTANRREEQAQHQRRWEARRDAYVELLSRVTQIESIAAGAVALGGPGHSGDKEVERAFMTASTTAEFFAFGTNWADMHPFVAAALLRYNATRSSAAPTFRSGALAALREVGADEESEWQRLRQQYLAAARRDLGIESGPAVRSAQ
jgi:hypothetical protein